LGNPNAWTRLPGLIGVTNSPMIIPLNPSSGTKFYRATLSLADPSQLQISLNSDGSVQLTLYGQPNTTYSIQSSTSLSNWTELRQVSFLANSFVSLRINPTSGSIFYRAQKLY